MNSSLPQSIGTHLEDLQSEMEAGSRKLDKIRDSIRREHFRQAGVMGTLVRRLEDLRASIRQQRETLQLLRHEIRSLRGSADDRQNRF